MIAQLAPTGVVPPATRRRSLLRSPSLLGPCSQGLTSLSNLIMMLAVAGALSSRDFGLFALVQTVSLVVEGVLRAAFGETLAVTGDGSPARRAGVVAAVALPAVALTAVGVAAAPLLPAGSARVLCVALALGLVPRVVADTLRHVAFAARTPAMAVLVDAVWLGVQLVTMVAAILAGVARPLASVAGWGVGALVAAVVGMRALGVDPHAGSWRDGWGWLVRHRRLARAYTTEFLILSASTQAVLVPVALLSSAETVAALRGAQLAFGPVTTLTLGLRSALTPHATALVREGRTAAVSRVVVGSSVGAVAVGLFVTVCMRFLPEVAGDALFGASWPAVAAVAVPFGLARAVFSGYVGPLIALRARTMTRAGVRLRTVSAVAWSGAMLLGTVLGGARLASWLLVFAAAGTLALYSLAATAIARPARASASAGLC